MKHCIAVLLAAVLSAGSVHAISGSITADETWSGTVTLDDDVSIESGTVTIEAGTRIEAAAGAQLQITGSGAVYAVGTSGNMITFTSAAASPAAGDWGGLYFNMCSNEAAMAFEYCIIEYAGTGMHSGNWNDSLSSAEPSDVTVDHCIFRHMSSNGLYGTAKADMRVSNSLVYDCTHSGMFLHGIDSAFVTNTVLYDISTGIVCPGAENADRYYKIDHITMYNVDMMKAGTNPKWWHGYGIFPTNTAGTLVLTNNVLVQSTLANYIARSAWTNTENNNCYHTGLLGLANIEDGTPGTGSIEQDPLFTDAAARDLSLDGLSPAIDAASDGSNMGAWQGGDFWFAPYVSGVRMPGGFADVLPGVTVRGDGVRGVVTVSADAAHDAGLYVTALDGGDTRLLAASVAAGTHAYTLDGMAPGVYVVTLIRDGCVVGAAQMAVVR